MPHVYHDIQETNSSTQKGGTMILQKNEMQQPFVFWLIREFLVANPETDEHVQPIGNREFYIWVGLISAAVIIYGTIFRFFAS